MTKKKDAKGEVWRSVGGSKVVHPPASQGRYQPPVPGLGVAPPVDPPAPPFMPAQPPGRVVFATIYGNVSFPAKSPLTVTGGAATVVETAVVGRKPGTTVGDPTRMTATVECIASARRWGGDVTAEVSLLVAAANAGALVRVYGPVVAPARQGLVWMLDGHPQMGDVQLRADGRMTHVPMTVSLSEWVPLERVTVRRAGDAARAMRKQQQVAKTNAGTVAATTWIGDPSRPVRPLGTVVAPVDGWS